MSGLEFKKFKSISRLFRDCTISEKIDGTNGLILFSETGDMLVGSRTREIFPEGTPGQEKGCDNYRFAEWCYENKESLFNYLGKGSHYGEWAGEGVQKNRYKVTGKRFYLFNTFRHSDIPKDLSDIGLDVVPVLYDGIFCTETVDDVMLDLEMWGSRLGGDKPEGVVVYHHASRSYYKTTFEHDDTGKPE